jgi:hypothetical protein
MAEHFLQVEHTSALPQIVHRECVPEGVNGAGRWDDAEPLAQTFHVPQHVPTPKPLPLLAGEYEVPPVELLPSIEVRPQFKRERDWVVLAALAVQLQQQVVQVNIRSYPPCGLRIASTGVHEREHKDVEPNLVKALWHPGQEFLYVGRGERGQDELRLLELLNFQR